MCFYSLCVQRCNGCLYPHCVRYQVSHYWPEQYTDRERDWTTRKVAVNAPLGSLIEREHVGSLKQCSEACAHLKAAHFTALIYNKHYPNTTAAKHKKPKCR